MSDLTRRIAEIANSELQLIVGHRRLYVKLELDHAAAVWHVVRRLAQLELDGKLTRHETRATIAFFVDLPPESTL